MEPISDPKNQAALDFDLLTSPLRRKAIELAQQTKKPALTERVKLIQETVYGTEDYAFSVILMHPGPPETLVNTSRPSWGIVAIRLPEVLIRTRGDFSLSSPVSVYIYDSTDDPDAPSFLAGAHFHAQTGAAVPPDGNLRFSPETELAQVRKMPHSYQVEKLFAFASREWNFVVVAQEGTYGPDLLFIALCASVIFVACCCLAFWVCRSSRRVTKMNQLRALAEVESVRRVAKNEREMNDFIAHEVCFGWSECVLFILFWPIESFDHGRMCIHLLIHVCCHGLLGP